MALVDWAERGLGYRFRDGQLLDLALTHRSASSTNNERLEFLGDAVLGAVIAHRLFEQHPDAGEGTLSRIRARLVRRETLAELAGQLDLGARIRLGSGETRTGGHQRSSILANALEAIIGAIYLDGGMAAASGFIVAIFGRRLDELPADDDLTDPKTRLQEWLQGRGFALPVYSVASVSGEPHAQHFRVSCEVAALGARTEGEGQSRRRAEQVAAEKLLAGLDS